jgi:hypothetical protein
MHGSSPLCPARSNGIVGRGPAGGITVATTIFLMATLTAPLRVEIVTVTAPLRVEMVTVTAPLRVELVRGGRVR